MGTKARYPKKLLFISAAGTFIALLISCYLWTDFEVEEVANIMLWVGALVIILGGSNFFPSSNYLGQSEASMFSLRFNKGPDHQGTIDKKESEITRRGIQGVFIALPGILLVIIALLLTVFEK